MQPAFSSYLDPQQSAERMQLALDAGQLGDWSWNAATDIVSLGPRAAELFSLPPAESVTWERLRELLVEEDRERARLAVLDAAHGHTDYSLEYRIAQPDGKRVWIAAQGRGIYSPDGTFEGMIGVVRDITEHKIAEELRNQLAAIVESSDDAIVSKSLDGVIRTWNAGAERIFGYTAEEVIGQSILTLIPDGRKHEEDTILGQLRRGERVEHFETVRLRKDGTLVPISLSVSPVKDASGQIIGAAKIARDITERKHAEAVLVRSEAALREEKQAIEIINQTGKVLSSALVIDELLQAVADAATKLSGARFGAFFYKNTDETGEVSELLAVSGGPVESLKLLGSTRVDHILGSVFRGSQPIRIDDVTTDPSFDQSRPPFCLEPDSIPVRSYLAVPVTTRSGEAVGALYFGHPEPGIFTARVEKIVASIASQAAVAIDNARLYEKVRLAAKERTELLEAERAARSEAERMNLMKDEFLATLSHELRTPLNAILGWSQVLAMNEAPNDEFRDGLEAIERNARVQTQLIEDLLDMSRIISGKIRLDIQTVELAGMVEAAVESVRPSADAKSIRLRTILDPAAGPVTGDPTRLQQVVWNLLSNAIKFTPKGGKVDVMLERVNSHLEITVRDSGVGIKTEFLPLVFERFRQADASTTRSFGGLGLGLSIVKSLIELHGGTVRAKSMGEGHGATFIVSLPLAPLRDDSERTHPTRSVGHSLNCDTVHLAGITVLVVDDEPDARALVSRVLIQCKADVLTAATAREALELLKKNKPNVLISDIGMPETDGYHFLRQVRQLSPEDGGKTPAIALTAFARSEDRTRAMMAGYQVHISKPIETQELLATVASLAGRTGQAI